MGEGGLPIDNLGPWVLIASLGCVGSLDKAKLGLFTFTGSSFLLLLFPVGIFNLNIFDRPTR